MPVRPSAILPAVDTIQEWLQTLTPSTENAFAPQNFRETFYPISIAAFVLLIVAVVLYNVQVRKLHRHPPLVALQEWLLWTAVCVFGLILVEAIFNFWYLTVVATIVIGLGDLHLDPVLPLPAPASSYTTGSWPGPGRRPRRAPPPNTRMHRRR